MKVAVVGGAGFLGRAVCSALRAQGDDAIVVDKANGIDIVDDAAIETLARAFDGASSVVHLAARVDPVTPQERDDARRLHVDGTKNVVAAAGRAGVSRLVLASSATVYGARASNRVPLDESAPVAPNADFPYAVDKAAQESIAQSSSSSSSSLAIGRPAIIYGPGARNYLTEIIRRAPFLPALDGRRPQLQFVHVDDAGAAFAFLARSDVVGAFNVASADWLALEDVAAIAGKRIVSVPFRAIAPVLDRLARVLPPSLRAPPSMLPYLMHPFVVSPAKLAAAGCAPRFSSADALRSILAR